MKILSSYRRSWSIYSLLILPILLLLGFAISDYKKVPDLEAVKIKFPPSEVVLLSSDGSILESSRINFKVRNIVWVPFHEISPHFFDEIIKQEDRRFFSHYGIDFWGMMAVANDFFFKKRKRGASTLTMQLARKIVPSLADIKGQLTVSEKIKQIYYAFLVHWKWSKREILEAYVNLVYFQGEIAGIGTISRLMWNKWPTALLPSESKILAKMVRRPAKGGGQSMGQSGKNILQDESLAPHLISYLKSRHYFQTGHRQVVRSTLNKELQQEVIKIVKQHVRTLSTEQNLHDMAVLVVENKTGKVLAYVGGAGEQSSNPYVDHVQSYRQAGSILKPFIYAIALQERYITETTLIKDEPFIQNIEATGHVYAPMNYDQIYHGTVMVKQALASSLNVPAIKILNMIGGQSLLTLLKSLSFRVERESGFYGPSLALGSLDVTLWNMVDAYRMLARGGIWSAIYAVENRDGEKNKKAEKQVLNPDAVAIISKILAEDDSRELTFGAHSLLERAYLFPPSVKTGTSKDMRDNWCIGYSEDYTVGVWAGNSDGSPLYRATGLTGAGPVWAMVMDRLQRELKKGSEGKKERRIPEGIIQLGENWYLKGTEPRKEISPMKQRERVDWEMAKILYPKDQMVFAIDPKIPKKNQKILVEFSGKREGLTLSLDDQIFKKRRNWWSPVRGHHRLILKNEENKVLEKVSFYVN